ncbi:putative 2-succinyl-6-hydroxy-2,4-cyclohexadiene-1-carboxylate synthase [Thalassobacillus devorans]|uniref:Putative 2-succinyl-6-hydroxy-2,4-cyclohexadiene-1-carboxylate synthase n=1 Tax=Thalassobacillus devorans TaxID=279813 RepID=A0ABQ1NP60_9BACI|nr:2-succinyl-6-hydroxy-2,4-cyclohexadiene-1-carboxylate synthase [Thalassobacillus devorans]NIK29097.1 2-succinyl-6-hydroxy-2,4-cyclohexadiene-1-carboxylate synthase [Thalassobacillus devorans]GGC81183.1 putative 2-succinyl-6-hydroxy-2,4-cyclohexadiene-1-carboxylate synthase [Thalassobacillus devorans]
MYYTIDGTKYWVEINGQGLPMMFLHGFTGSTRTWDDVAGLLIKKGFQVITIDLPGHGKTIYNTGHKLSMKRACHDLKSLADELNLSTFNLTGYSMGGRTALSFAALYPDYIAQLILESASPGLESNEDQQARISKDERLAKKLEDEGILSFVDFWENLPLFDSQRRLPEKVKRKIREERLSQSADGLALSLRGMGTGVQPSWWERLEQLELPVQLIVGESDKKFVSINERMKSKISDSSLHVIREAGHAVHVEQPKLFAEIVSEFVLE